MQALRYKPIQQRVLWRSLWSITFCHRDELLSDFPIDLHFTLALC